MAKESCGTLGPIALVHWVLFVLVSTNTSIDSKGGGGGGGGFLQ